MNLTFARRELIAGSAAGVGTVSFLGGSRADAAVSNPTGSPGIPISTVLRINGREYRVSHDIRASLLDTLCEQFGLAGAKRGCDEGQCGACTVHVDGKPRLSCLTLTVGAEGQQITMIEGLAPSDSQRHPMQQAFVDGDAFPCEVDGAGRMAGRLRLRLRQLPEQFEPGRRARRDDAGRQGQRTAGGA